MQKLINLSCHQRILHRQIVYKTFTGKPFFFFFIIAFNFKYEGPDRPSETKTNSNSCFAHNRIQQLCRFIVSNMHAFWHKHTVYIFPVVGETERETLFLDRSSLRSLFPKNFPVEKTSSFFYPFFLVNAVCGWKILLYTHIRLRLFCFVTPVFFFFPGYSDNIFIHYCLPVTTETSKCLVTTAVSKPEENTERETSFVETHHFSWLGISVVCSFDQKN